MIFAAREPDEENDAEEQELPGIPELVVTGLARAEARALLSSTLAGPVDDRVLDRIVAETRGNPLALLELPRGLSSAELAGGFGLPATVALPKRIEESFRRQLAPLPADTRQLLVIATAEALGDPVLLWGAAQELGIGHGAEAPAAMAGLLSVGARVRFRHPLLRSAIHRAATVEEWQTAHRALAEAIDPDTDPDRRAWHRAQATSGPDEDVAADLERCAGRARARGGLAAAAAFLERATHLTRDPARRAERALAAAQAKHQAGAPDTAIELLSTASAGPFDLLQHARVDLLRAQIAFTVNRGRDAPPLLLCAARELESLDVRLARETYLDALDSAIFAGPLAGGGDLRKAAEAARVAPVGAWPPRASDLLLDGLAVAFTEGYAAAIPMLRQALAAFSGPELSEDEGLRWSWLTCRIARSLWDEATWEVVVTRFLQLAREAGALSVLPLALSARCIAHVLAGELPAAAALCDEMRAVTEATGSPFVPYGALLLAAWQGRGGVHHAGERHARGGGLAGEGLGVSVTGLATAVLLNGFGRYEDALIVARRSSEQPEVLKRRSSGRRSSSSRRRLGAGCPRPLPTPCTGNETTRATATSGGWVSRPAVGR